MNDFLEILQYMAAAGTKPKQLFSRQASRHDKTRENRLSATRRGSEFCGNPEPEKRTNRAGAWKAKYWLVAAPPSSVMNWRRLRSSMGSPQKPWVRAHALSFRLD